MAEADIKKDFFHHVNMSIKELEAWLDDELSMNTGLAADDGEPKGHKSGRETLALLKKHGEGKKGMDASYSEEEFTHMKHVNAYCKRHLKQGNSKDPEHSKWRYSLMNWACDPLKKPIGDADKVVMPGKQGKDAMEKGAKSPDKKAEGTKSPEKKAEAAKSPSKASPEKKADKAASPEKKADKAASPEKKPASPTKRKQDEAKAENGKDDAKKQKTDA